MKHTIIFHTIGLAKKLQKELGFKSADLPLSYSQASALLVIDSEKEINQNQIAQRLHLEPPSIVTLVDELEKQGLVTRSLFVGDRRKYQIELTKKGKDTATRLKSVTTKLDNYLKNSLSHQEAKSFMSILEKLTNLTDLNQLKKGGVNEVPGTKQPLAA